MILGIPNLQQYLLISEVELEEYRHRPHFHRRQSGHCKIVLHRECNEKLAARLSSHYYDRPPPMTVRVYTHYSCPANQSARI